MTKQASPLDSTHEMPASMDAVKNSWPEPVTAKSRVAEASVWSSVANLDEVPSPALLVYPERIEANIAKMIAIAGGASRLRPHVKTHKLPEIVRLQQAAGIQKFKCATIAEAEMVAQCGAGDVLLAMQPVGPNTRRLIELTKAYPATRFAAIGDDAENLRAISNQAQAARTKIEILLDLDCGMHRTGIAPGARALELYQLLTQLPGLTPGGLHVYDGHTHDRDRAARRKVVATAMAPVWSFRQMLADKNYPVPRIVAGGTPTFPIHAGTPDVECSPGTCLLWDAGYREELPDLDFLCAAVLLTRVISKPGANLLCLDLGHKAVASEKPHPRVQLLKLPDAVAVTHSEEHLVIETPRAAEFAVGDALLGIPRHICPTVALHASVTVIRAGRAGERWKVSARDRALTI